MLTRSITAELTFATHGYANRHGAESRLQIPADATSAAIYMIAMLHHDLEFLVNFVIFGLCSGCQICLYISVRVTAVGATGGSTLVFFLA